MRIKFYVLVLATIFVMPPVASAQAGWVIESFDADVVIQTNGTVRVKETVVVDFASQAKHGIYRDLPVTYFGEQGKEYSRVENITVLQDGFPAQVKVTQNSANKRIRVGVPDQTISGEHVYAISYDVIGVMKSYDGFDELYWNVTGSDWEAPIESASATVNLPATIKQAACYQGNVGSEENCEFSEIGENSAYFSASDIAPGHDFTIAIGFAPGIIDIPVVEAPPSFAAVLMSGRTIALAVVVFLAGLAILLRRWWFYGRDRYWQRAHLPGERSDRDGLNLKERILPLSIFKETIPVEYGSPDNLRPAELGVLIDERADTIDISATIVDLAQRGYLTIIEIEKKWLFGKVDYQLKRTGKDFDELVPYEKKLMTKLFDEGTDVKLSEIRNKFYKDLKEIEDLLYQQVVEKKLFAARPDKMRFKYLRVAGLFNIGGLVLLALSAFIVNKSTGLAIYHYLLTGLASGAFFLSAPLSIVSRLMPRKTGYGRELYRRSKGFQLFVSGTEKYRSKFFEEEGMFEQVLPYAVMFGVTDKLAKVFADAGKQPPQPSWYYGVHAFNVSDFSSGVNSFSKSLSTAMASSPSSSGSGGGGFSGGGAGGGGGGSW